VKAARDLQNLIGVRPDGIVGKDTIGKLHDLTEQDLVAATPIELWRVRLIIQQYAQWRRRFLAMLLTHPGQEQFQEDWMGRAARVEVAAQELVFGEGEVNASKP